jgi:predicted helicase
VIGNKFGIGPQILLSKREVLAPFKFSVNTHLLPRLFGFELLMAPYAVAHLKLGLELAQTGYDFKDNERLRVYLTNTLEEEFEVGRLPFAEWLVEEATAAGNVKYDAPVMVVIGNPPYSGHSANKGVWITNLLHDKQGNYFEVDGKSLGERNPKWLNDDYVKFIRFAQWRIERTGYGILAFITNHGYLDNPTFRGMRQSLMQSFDEIYVLDLHGNSKKKERAPDDTKDENVFDIQQGVAIGIFVKRRAKIDVAQVATVRHAHLWGPREVYQEHGQRLIAGKYHWLAEKDITTTEWSLLMPEKPFYLFVPQDIDLRAEYEQGWKATEAMPVNAIGMNSHRDFFAIAFDTQTLERRIKDLVSTHLTDDEVVAQYALINTSDFNLSKARNALRKVNDLSRIIIPCLYRPFDHRAVLYHADILDRPRTEINYHFVDRDNLGLVTTRQTREPFAALAVNKVCGQHKIVATYDGSSIFPLYLYHDPNKNGLFDTDEASTVPGGRRPNLSMAFITDISNKLNMTFIPDGKGDLQQTFGPEDVFDYMYAVFHSPTYRTRYGEFLKIDFPRLPLTSNTDLFRALCKLGDRLVGLHLMEKFGNTMPTYPIDGNQRVEKVEYLASPNQPQSGRVYINKTQYFNSVPTEVWEFYIGGYQVCHKWLKDRKGRTLSYEDIQHYQRIVAALAETITLMEKIDETIEEHGGWPIE